MRSGVSDTSIENYHLHRDSGELGRQAAAVLAFIEHMPARDVSRRELAFAMKMELSSVCGRVNELLKAGLLVEGDKRACRMTGKTVHPVRPAKPQLDLWGTSH